jgi:hypothetical protein
LYELKIILGRYGELADQVAEVVPMGRGHSHPPIRHLIWQSIEP